MNAKVKNKFLQVFFIFGFLMLFASHGMSEDSSEASDTISGSDDSSSMIHEPSTEESSESDDSLGE